MIKRDFSLKAANEQASKKLTASFPGYSGFKGRLSFLFDSLSGSKPFGFVRSDDTNLIVRATAVGVDVAGEKILDLSDLAFDVRETEKVILPGGGSAGVPGKTQLTPASKTALAEAIADEDVRAYVEKAITQSQNSHDQGILRGLTVYRASDESDAYYVSTAREIKMPQGWVTRNETRHFSATDEGGPSQDVAAFSMTKHYRP